MSINYEDYENIFLTPIDQFYCNDTDNLNNVDSPFKQRFSFIEDLLNISTIEEANVNCSFDYSPRKESLKYQIKEEYSINDDTNSTNNDSSLSKVVIKEKLSDYFDFKRIKLTRYEIEKKLLINCSNFEEYCNLRNNNNEKPIKSKEQKLPFPLNFLPDLKPIEDVVLPSTKVVKEKSKLDNLFSKINNEEGKAKPKENQFILVCKDKDKKNINKNKKKKKNKNKPELKVVNGSSITAASKGAK